MDNQSAARNVRALQINNEQVPYPSTLIIVCPRPGVPGGKLAGRTIRSLIDQ